MHFNQLKYAKRIFVYTLSVVLLFCGFFANVWHVAEGQWFVDHQRDMESYIVGRMVKSRRDGIFSDGALTGIVSLNANPKSFEPSFQYEAYIHGLTFDAFSVYKSQVGGQGMFFSFLDRLTPLTPEANLQLFQIWTSLLSAIVVGSIILWFYLEFGVYVAIFAMSSAVFSQWLTVFGRNLYWSLWSFYLPIAVVMYFLRHRRMSTKRHVIEFGILTGGSIFVKCLVSGYEYITTTLIMMTVPFFYDGILDRWDSRRWLKGICAAALGSCFALFMSFGVLCVQIWSITGNRLDGVRHIVHSLEKRTCCTAPALNPALLMWC